MRDEFDVLLSRSLKNWAARFSPPKEGRKELLQKAAQTARNEKGWLARLLEWMQPGPFEPYALVYSGSDWTVAPRSHAQLWIFYLATSWRLAN